MSALDVVILGLAAIGAYRVTVALDGLMFSALRDRLWARILAYVLLAGALIAFVQQQMGGA